MTICGFNLPGGCQKQAADGRSSVRTHRAPGDARAHAGLINLDRVTRAGRGMGADDCRSIK